MKGYTSLGHNGLESLSLRKDERTKGRPEFPHSNTPSEHQQGTRIMQMADSTHPGATNLTIFQPTSLTAWHAALRIANAPFTALTEDPAEFLFTQALLYLRVLEYGKCAASVASQVQCLQASYRLQMAADGSDICRTEIAANEGLLYTVSWYTLKTIVRNDIN